MSEPMETVIHRIRVDVETSYLDEQSEPREGRYVFSYTITIQNATAQSLPHQSDFHIL